MDFSPEHQSVAIINSDVWCAIHIIRLEQAPFNSGNHHSMPFLLFFWVPKRFFEDDTIPMGSSLSNKPPKPLKNPIY